MTDLEQLGSHFAFGENWKSFVDGATQDSIDEAVRSLERLLPRHEIEGRHVLDIGCGSGLSMLAAARLGAASVTGIDIDPNSVEAARRLLSRFGSAGWKVQAASILDLSPGAFGTFDIVHSWGVLHHTGNMERAVRNAAALVAPGGTFAFALYRKTPLCGLWRVEKRIYTHAPKPAQALARGIFKTVYCAGLLASGRNPVRYIRDYGKARGMDWSHDVHDWLGGYPYESVTPADVDRLLDGTGLTVIRANEKPAALAGLLGSHCDEYVAKRSQ